MSGGSYDYYYAKLANGEAQFNQTCQMIEGSIKLLEKIGLKQEAIQMGLMLFDLNQLEIKLCSFEDIFHDVEWVQSGDSSLDQLKESVMKRRKKMVEEDKSQMTGTNK